MSVFVSFGNALRKLYRTVNFAGIELHKRCQQSKLFPRMFSHNFFLIADSYDAMRKTLDATYIVADRTYKYSTTPIKANIHPTIVGITAPNVKVIPITNPSMHSAR